MTRYRNALQLPVPEMPAAQLARYHRVLASSLRRCREEHLRYRQMRACPADVLAEDRARRLARPCQRKHAAGASYPPVNEPVSAAA